MFDMDELSANNWSRIPWEQVRPGVKRKVFTGEGATLSLNAIDPGHDPKPHSHMHEQIVYIIEGDCDFHVGDAVHRLLAGGLLCVPPDVEHYIVVTGDKPVVNLDVFTPKRADYVK
jgi:quercetin dioxygenase-like cupin family protein